MQNKSESDDIIYINTYLITYFTIYFKIDIKLIEHIIK